MNSLVPLKLIFVTLTDKKGNKIKSQVAFYELFGGIVEVIAADGLQSEQTRPELVIEPINKYDAYQHETLTLWIKHEQKEKIGQAIRDMFDKEDPLSMIFSGRQVSAENDELTDTSFCVKALRTALPILPDLPLNCVTTRKLYTVLKMMGGI